MGKNIEQENRLDRQPHKRRHRRRLAIPDEPLAITTRKIDDWRKQDKESPRICVIGELRVLELEATHMRALM